MRAVVDKRRDFLPLLLVSSLFLSPVENETIEFTWNKRRKCYEKYAIARFKCTLKSYSLVLNNISVYLFNEMIFFPFFCTFVHAQNLCENIYLFVSVFSFTSSSMNEPPGILSIYYSLRSLQAQCWKIGVVCLT